MKRIIDHVATAAILVLPLSSMALAQEAKTFVGYENAAWEKVYEGLQQNMPIATASRLKFLVYHNVAVTLCDDLKTDAEKVQVATAELHPENWEELSQEDRTQWTNTFLVNYGIIFGVMLAEHAEHAEPFCEEARQTAADKETESYFDAAM